MSPKRRPQTASDARDAFKNMSKPGNSLLESEGNMMGSGVDKNNFFMTGINQIPEEPLSAVPHSAGLGQESTNSMQE